ncbi:MAG: UPF0182 family protein [Syntrophomonadaceae bacterium]|jgi:uncharacterized membrane protein (UPF0182 family)|nr:UPF0182 family protein [Syntrophomonadaceae bacterium]
MSQYKSTIKLIVFFLLLAAASLLINMYIDWLWFKSVSFQEVFTTILFNKIGLYALIFLVTLGLFYINLWLTRKNISDDEPRLHNDNDPDIIYLERPPSIWKELLTGQTAKYIFLAISIFAAFMVSSVAADNWLVVQQYLNGVKVGVIDPIFNKDLGFYFFNLTFYQFIYSTLMMLLVLLLLAVILIYASNTTNQMIYGRLKEFSFAKGHLAVLLAAIFALKAWGYRLDAYQLLFSPGGIVFGATYTDINARLLAYKVMLALSIIIALLLLANIFVRKMNLVYISIGTWAIVAILLGTIYPSLLQSLVVQPNEFNKERPYLENAIKFTRQAYGLDKAQSIARTVDYDLNINDSKHTSTIKNIRLWDWQPSKTTYKNLQQLRSYYVFNDVDIDRYELNGESRQLMLSAREIDQSELPAQAKTWINQKLMYTHGYGVVVSPVTEITTEGFPEFYIKDIPPQFSTDLTITRPEIYFGEKTDDYVIVNTKQKEFDYPMGEQNVFSTYEGHDGVKIQSLPRKLMLAWVLKDYKMLLSSDITNDSQVLMYRNVVERIRKIAPYLAFDGDPYIIIDEKGKLYWMQDAYTYTNKYPYSQPFDDWGNNYIRNSVKIITDAYSGEVNFYIADDSDPIVNTLRKVFPNLYKSIDEMPADLRKHVRYPVDMFMVQAEMYTTFHMSDPWVFYNKEDPWIIPNEIVDDKQQKMEPYYINMTLDQDEGTEFVLMMPFSPKSRPNMIAWMGARMDGDNYGKMMVYNFPKQETIYGPEQVESRINQNTSIAQQLTLWDQRGVRVYRGNLLVIPVDNSILYIEPIYLQADNSKLPELKRIIAGFGEKLVMEPTLDEALLKLFGEGPRPPEAAKPDVDTPDVDTPEETPFKSVQELAQQARDIYDRANEQLKEGNWAGYGESIEKLNVIISELEAAAN